MIFVPRLIESLESRCLLSADLAVGFSGRVPSAISLTALNRVTVSLTNHGDAIATGPATVQLYAADTASIDTASVLIGTAKLSLKLKVNQSIKTTFSFKASATVSTGSHLLLATVIPGFIEAGTTNDTIASSAVRFTQPVVDLTDTLTLSPTTTKYTVGAKAQKPLKFTLTIRNAGNVVAKGSAAVNLFESTNITLTGLDPLLAGLGNKRLIINPGKTAKITLLLKPSAAVQSGTFYGVAQINANGGIAESTKDNNIAVTANQFTIVNGAKPIVPSLTGGLTDNISVVVVGSPETVHFSASVLNSTPSTAIEVDETDAVGSVLGKITDLSDDGSQANADSAAGDGIFSGIAPVSFSAPGTRYFVAKLTDTTTGSASGTAALSIPGVMPLTDVQLAQDDVDAASVDQAATSAQQSGGSVSQIIGAVAASMRSSANVVGGSVQTTDADATWTGLDGVVQLFSIDEFLGQRGASETYVPGAAGAVPASSSPSATRAASSADASIVARPADAAAVETGSGTATVIAAYNFNFAPSDEAPGISTTLTNAGYDVTYRANTTVAGGGTSLADFQNFAGNSAIVITSHGTNNQYGDVINSGVKVAADPRMNHSADLLNHRLLVSTSVTAYGSAYDLTPAFFAAYLGSLDGTVVYLGACKSGTDGSLANAFLQAGAAAVVGYTDSVESGFAVNHANAMFNTMLADTSNTVADIPGINVDVNTRTGAIFKSFGDLKATLPPSLPLKDVNLVVTYTWPANQKDLDSKTIFAGAADGFNLAGGTYLKWFGDNQGAAGSETTVVDLYDAWAAGLFSKTISVGVGADWYTPDGGAGPAVIKVALENIHTLKQYQVQSLTIQPGDETNGATSQQGAITVKLTGGVTNPGVQIKLVAAGATT